MTEEQKKIIDRLETLSGETLYRMIPSSPFSKEMQKEQDEYKELLKEVELLIFKLKATLL